MIKQTLLETVVILVSSLEGLVMVVQTEACPLVF